MAVRQRQRSWRQLLSGIMAEDGARELVSQRQRRRLPRGIAGQFLVLKRIAISLAILGLAAVLLSALISYFEVTFLVFQP